MNEEALARSNILTFLASWYLTPPEEILKGLTPGHIKDIHTVFDGYKGEDMVIDGLRNPDIDRLSEDYDALFQIPQQRFVHPYESVYREGIMWGGCTGGVKKYYDSVGFNAAEVPDHVGVELLFLAALTKEEVETGCAAEIKELQERFLSEHLQQWIPKLDENIQEKAATGMYKGIAQLTAEYIS